VAEIRAGILSEGLSRLVYRALRPDGTAACSSYLNVRDAGIARDVAQPARCKARACQKLFAQAAAQDQGEGNAR
jgi:hypothetical protein